MSQYGNYHTYVIGNNRKVCNNERIWKHLLDSRISKEFQLIIGHDLFWNVADIGLLSLSWIFLNNNPIKQRMTTQKECGKVFFLYPWNEKKSCVNSIWIMRIHRPFLYQLILIHPKWKTQLKNLFKSNSRSLVLFLRFHELQYFPLRSFILVFHEIRWEFVLNKYVNTYA